MEPNISKPAPGNVFYLSDFRKSRSANDDTQVRESTNFALGPAGYDWASDNALTQIETHHVVKKTVVAALNELKVNPNTLLPIIGGSARIAVQSVEIKDAHLSHTDFCAAIRDVLYSRGASKLPSVTIDLDKDFTLGVIVNVYLPSPEQFIPPHRRQ